MKNLILFSGIIAALFSLSPSLLPVDFLMQYAAHMATYMPHDKQKYMVLLNGEETGEFHIVFGGGCRYKISVSSRYNNGSLIFSVYDQEKRILFSNKDYDNIPYWYFEFNGKINCIIEVQLDARKTNSGLTVLQIEPVKP